jgi:hypothetical protein
LFGVETGSNFINDKDPKYTYTIREIYMGNELIDAAVVCSIITLVGLAVGFALLKFQGD